MMAVLEWYLTSFHAGRQVGTVVVVVMSQTGILGVSSSECLEIMLNQCYFVWCLYVIIMLHTSDLDLDQTIQHCSSNLDQQCLLL
jgi:hypothetical protein